VQAKFKELTLHKSKLEGHTHKLQAQITELQSQERNREGVLSESDVKVQESCSSLQIAESALRAALMSAEGAMKRHAHELATLHQQVAKARSELEASGRETDRFKFELASAETRITAKDEELKSEAVKWEQQVAQARARTLQLVREHRRRSSSPARGHMQRSLSRDNSSPFNASAATALSRKAQDEMLEGELECQFRLEALPDAEVRPELMRVGLANVRFFSASPALPALTSQQTFDLYLSLIPPFLSVPHIFF
jgi:chromosome segregation ATPase